MKMSRIVPCTTGKRFCSYKSPWRKQNGSRRGGSIANYAEKFSAYPDCNVTARQWISFGLVKHRVWRKGTGEGDRCRRHKVASSLRETTDCACQRSGRVCCRRLSARRNQYVDVLREQWDQVLKVICISRSLGPGTVIPEHDSASRISTQSVVTPRDVVVSAIKACI